ncbi:MAG: hypothetical protein RLZZ15_4411 [Verrucomicrobiota bacterium]|jgi:hypothetical protein
MISSASSSDRTLRPETLGAASAPLRAPAPRPDRISTAGAAFLRAALVRQPEIRPEVVARARALAADPGYPPPAVLRAVAQQILAAPDLGATDA